MRSNPAYQFNESSRAGNCFALWTPSISHPLPKATDHVQIDHRQSSGQGIDRLFHVVGRADEAKLLTTEGDEDHGSCGRRSGQASRHLNEGRYSGGVIISAVVYRPGAVGIQAAEAAEPQMIVMGAQNDSLVPENAVTPGKNPNDVLSDQGAGGRSRRRCVSPQGERLEPSSRRRG